MNNPSLDTLLKRVDCRYTLVMLAAKRAREIICGDGPLIESHSNKPVTIALEEIAGRKVTYQRTRNGIK
jgi:DNA-directed RNA polymerase subunit omega